MRALSKCSVPGRVQCLLYVGRVNSLQLPSYTALCHILLLQVWRKRYFKLRSSKVLEYYKNETADQQKGVINLEDCTSVHSDLSHKKYKFVFDIETRTRVFYLVAQDQQEMKQWVDVLCRVCGLTVHQGNQCVLGGYSCSYPCSSHTHTHTHIHARAVHPSVVFVCCK